MHGPYTFVPAQSGIFSKLRTKVIVHKLRGEVSLVEQDTIECVSVDYVKFIFKFSSKYLWFSHLYLMQLFSADATILKKYLFRP